MRCVDIKCDLNHDLNLTTLWSGSCYQPLVVQVQQIEKWLYLGRK